LTALATICSGLHKQLKIGEHLTNAVACSARLNALKFSLLVSPAATKEIEEQYKKIPEKYSYYMT
jgi:fructose-1-phosphate kinase PfkB-like protein